MALIAVELPRVFMIEVDKQVIELQDPNPSMSIEDVKDIYTVQYTELLNAKIINKGVEDSKIVYEFKTVAGTKG